MPNATPALPGPSPRPHAPAAPAGAAAPPGPRLHRREVADPHVPGRTVVVERLYLSRARWSNLAAEMAGLGWVAEPLGRRSMMAERIVFGGPPSAR